MGLNVLIGKVVLTLWPFKECPRICGAPCSSKINVSSISISLCPWKRDLLMFPLPATLVLSNILNIYPSIYLLIYLSIYLTTHPSFTFIRCNSQILYSLKTATFLAVSCHSGKEINVQILFVLFYNNLFTRISSSRIL